MGDEYKNVGGIINRMFDNKYKGVKKLALVKDVGYYFKKNNCYKVDTITKFDQPINFDIYLNPDYKKQKDVS